MGPMGQMSGPTGLNEAIGANGSLGALVQWVQHKNGAPMAPFPNGCPVPH